MIPKNDSAAWPNDLLSAQPTTIRENRSMITVKYNQPLRVARYVISDTHTLSGACSVTFRSSKFGDTAKWCLLLVVTMETRGRGWLSWINWVIFIAGFYNYRRLIVQRQVRFNSPGTLQHVIVGDWKGVALAKFARRVGRFNLCRIQNYSAGQPVSQLSQQRPWVFSHQVWSKLDWYHNLRLGLHVLNISKVDANMGYVKSPQVIKFIMKPKF